MQVSGRKAAALVAAVAWHGAVSVVGIKVVSCFIRFLVILRFVVTIVSSNSSLSRALPSSAAAARHSTTAAAKSRLLFRFSGDKQRP
jgi:hypothetical protein